MWTPYKKMEKSDIKITGWKYEGQKWYIQGYWRYEYFKIYLYNWEKDSYNIKVHFDNIEFINEDGINKRGTYKEYLQNKSN